MIFFIQCLECWNFVTNSVSGNIDMLITVCAVFLHITNFAKNEEHLLKNFVFVSYILKFQFICKYFLFLQIKNECDMHVDNIAWCSFYLVFIGWLCTSYRRSIAGLLYDVLHCDDGKRLWLGLDTCTYYYVLIRHPVLCDVDKTLSLSPSGQEDYPW